MDNKHSSVKQVRLPDDWQKVLSGEWTKPYFLQLRQFLEQEYAQYTVYPAKEDVWNALRATPFGQVRVVILGQDPYHGPGQAHGLSFSVQPGIPHPPSLRNMLQELANDLDCKVPRDGTLLKWTEQGVLLLNTVMTVRAGEAHSHKGRGWELFTDTIIEALAKREQTIIFILWGKPAGHKRSIIVKHNKEHIILEAPHPSPLSAFRGFFGSKPYSTVNAQLTAWGQQPIDWCLED